MPIHLTDDDAKLLTDSLSKLSQVHDDSAADINAFTDTLCEILQDVFKRLSSEAWDAYVNKPHNPYSTSTFDGQVFRENLIGDYNRVAIPAIQKELRPWFSQIKQATRLSALIDVARSLLGSYSPRATRYALADAMQAQRAPIFAVAGIAPATTDVVADQAKITRVY